MKAKGEAFMEGIQQFQSETMRAALNLPNGARFYRCALQVNPFAYLARHSKPTSFQSEDEYNAAIIKACLETKTEVIGVTDHYRVQDSKGLVDAAREAGIWAFNGFEAVTKDGVHFLCLFDSDKDKELERYIGECGIHNSNESSPIGKLDSPELLEHSRGWEAICIAAHVASDGGLLRKLSGQTRVKVWTSPNLLACALPGQVGDAPEDIRPILQNKNAEHKRTHPPAIINASDVNDPEDLKENRSSCFIKMSDVSVEALRQAFLDPDSRIRLHSDSQPEFHAEFQAITWETEGFLRNTSVHFNRNLNTLIGGRGTGKSTIIESIRYVLGLDPIGEDARKTHEGVIQHVLKSGTKVSLLVRSHKPSERHYTIERSVPNPPTVKDENGEILMLSPQDVMPGVEVFGQHEISELTKSPEKLTLLLERFIDRDPSLAERKASVQLELEKSRSRIVGVIREMKSFEDRLAALPGLEEMQKRFQEAGLEEKLKEKSFLIREERLFSNVEERLAPLRVIHRELADEISMDTAFASQKALEGLPNARILNKIEEIFETLSTRLKEIGDQLGQALSETDLAIADTKSHWSEQRRTIEETYEKLLRELQKSNIDGSEFIRLRQDIEELRPLKDRTEKLKRDLSTHESNRRMLLLEWEDIKATEYRKTEAAARKVSNELSNRVRVEVTMSGNRDPLEQLLREKVGGNLAATLERLRRMNQLSLPEFTQRCREGKESLIENYDFPPGAADRIAQGGLDFFMRIEELELPATPKIELNTATDNEQANWRKLEALSTGQKATAILLLLLLETEHEAPLVVDQPEDDLDNRFITDGIVPIIKQEKRRRQFVFSTHNANIPVLGDAELILGLTAFGDSNKGQAKIAPEHMGSIDSKPVRDLVEEVLEGGKDAFEMRRSKYGF